MKKNYIAPNTELATWASMGLMQAPSIGLGVTSGANAGQTPVTNIPGDAD